MKKSYVVIALLVVVVIGFLVFNSQNDKKPSRDIDVNYYYNPGCPHCRHFMPVWKDFVSSGGANFIETNCSENPEKCKAVRGVPWVVFSKNGGNKIPFTGSRDKASLQSFLNAIN